MTTLARLRVAWSGTGVTGPGVSTFYSVGSGADLQSAAVTLFGALKFQVPASVFWTVAAGGETIDDNTGALVGAWSGSAATVIAGTGSLAHAQGVGARIVWETSGIVGGRRSRGTTFVCPISLAAFDDDGTLKAPVVSSMQDAATTFIGTLGTDLVVLSRNTSSHSGTSHSVTSARVPDAVSWLRSRRT